MLGKLTFCPLFQSNTYFWNFDNVPASVLDPEETKIRSLFWWSSRCCDLAHAGPLTGVPSAFCDLRTQLTFQNSPPQHSFPCSATPVLWGGHHVLWAVFEYLCVACIPSHICWFLTCIPSHICYVDFSVFPTAKTPIHLLSIFWHMG